MPDTEARTAEDEATPDTPPSSRPRPRGYGEYDGYAAPLPVTAQTVPPKPGEAKPLPAKSNPAEWMFDRLVRMIDDYEKGLSEDEEIGGRMVGAPGEGSFHIDDIGFWGPDLIMFFGKNHHGRPIRLIQHYTQLSVLLTSMPKVKDKPRRIGFVLRERQEEEQKAAAEALPDLDVDAPPEEKAAAAEVEAHPS